MIMKCVVYFDLATGKRPYDTAEAAIDAVEKELTEKADGLVIRRRSDEDGSHSTYTREELLAALSERGCVTLQLADETGDVMAEIADVMTVEYDEAESARNAVEMAALGQQLADSYDTEVVVGRQQFKPGKK